MSWTTPRTWVAAETVTAALMNTHLRDQLNALTVAASFTPGWTGISVGNGSNVGNYISAGKLVLFQVELTFGSTTSVSAGIQLTVPVTSNTFGAGPGVQVTGFDSSANKFYSGQAVNASATLISLGDQASPLAFWAAAVPFTWATSDILWVTGCYLAA